MIIVFNEKREGILKYDAYEDRYYLYQNEDYMHNFHCGDCFEIYYAEDNEWVEVRLEMDNNGWYLIGGYCRYPNELLGHRIRR